MTIDPVYTIIMRKKSGNDCTEQESAEIKGWLKENSISPLADSSIIIEDIKHLFPIEYGEYLDETNQ